MPDELTPRVGAGVGQECAAHHRLGGLVGRHGELALLGDLAVVRTGVDAVHDKVRTSLICVINIKHEKIKTNMITFLLQLFLKNTSVGIDSNL